MVLKTLASKEFRVETHPKSGLGGYFFLCSRPRHCRDPLIIASLHPARSFAKLGFLDLLVPWPKRACPNPHLCSPLSCEESQRYCLVLSNKWHISKSKHKKHKLTKIWFPAKLLHRSYFPAQLLHKMQFPQLPKDFAPFWIHKLGPCWSSGSHLQLLKEPKVLVASPPSPSAQFPSPLPGMVWFHRCTGYTPINSKCLQVQICTMKTHKTREAWVSVSSGITFSTFVTCDTGPGTVVAADCHEHVFHSSTAKWCPNRFKAIWMFKQCAFEGLNAASTSTALERSRRK